MMSRVHLTKKNCFKIVAHHEETSQEAKKNGIALLLDFLSKPSKFGLHSILLSPSSSANVSIQKKSLKKIVMEVGIFSLSMPCPLLSVGGVLS